MSPTAPLTLSCHCKAFIYTIPLSTADLASLPQKNTTCNCNSCRLRTGNLTLTTFELPPDPTTGQPVQFPPAGTNTSTLQRYTSFPPSGRPVHTWFCSVCGTKLAIQTSDDNHHVERTGIMLGGLSMIEGFIDIRGHELVSDTRDGGVAAFWRYRHSDQGRQERDVQGKHGGKQESLQWWAGECQEPSDEGLIWGTAASDSAIQSLQTPTNILTPDTKHSATSNKYLTLRCHCSAFTVYISRPAPPPSSDINIDAWVTQPPNDPSTGHPTRYLGNLCACTSCRRTTGSCMPAVPWIVVPVHQVYTSIYDADSVNSAPTSTEKGSKNTQLQPHQLRQFFDLPMTPGSTPPEFPGLTRYQSSLASTGNGAVGRYHCSTCGASVMFFHAEGPETVEFAGGLVAPENDGTGCLAEDWIAWSGIEENERGVKQINQKDDAIGVWGTAAVDAFEKGVAEWSGKVGWGRSVDGAVVGWVMP